MRLILLSEVTILLQFPFPPLLNIRGRPWRADGPSVAPLSLSLFDVVSHGDSVTPDVEVVQEQIAVS
jgi:hypothetical protein